MHKKTLALCVGAVVLATFALAPAMASAVVLTDKTGVVPANTILRGTNTGILVWTIPGSGKIECSTSTMEGEVTENSGSSFKWNVTGAGFSGTGASGDCTSPLGAVKVTTPSLPWCLSSKTADAFEIRGGKCSESAKSLTFSMDVTGVGTCSYSKSSVAGTFTTAVEKSAFSVEKQEFAGAGEGNSFFCPATLEWEWVYEWETNVFPFHPIYVS